MELIVLAFYFWLVVWPLSLVMLIIQASLSRLADRSVVWTVPIISIIIMNLVIIGYLFTNQLFRWQYILWFPAAEVVSLWFPLLLWLVFWLVGRLSRAISKR